MAGWVDGGYDDLEPHGVGNKVAGPGPFQDYIDEADRQKKKYRRSLNSFGLKMGRLCPGINKERLQIHKSSGRINYYVFPALIECREMFDAYMGCKNDWPEFEEEEAQQAFDAFSEDHEPPF